MYVYRPAHCAVRVLYYLLCLNTFTNTTSGCVNTCCANTQPAVPNSQDLSPKSDKACHRYHSTDCCGCHKQPSDGVTHHTTRPAFFSAKQELILQIRDTLTCCVILHAMQDDTEHTVAIYTHLCVRCNYHSSSLRLQSRASILQLHHKRQAKMHGGSGCCPMVASLCGC
jgi:hypothetical protein